MPFPLITKRLIVRPFRLSDDDAFHTVLGDPEVMKDIPGGPSPSVPATRSKLRRIIEMQDRYGLSMWALIERESNTIIGDCGLMLVEGKGPEIELTYDIAREKWGEGFATEAAHVCLKYGFEELDLEEIIAITYPHHQASRRVMEKAGMTYRRVHRYYDRDMVVYSYTREEYSGFQGAVPEATCANASL
jgi:RimJ/RimL family protein N-acetyltransferase